MSMMMDNSVITSSRKPVVCRYFAASGTCFYGNDCQFLHNVSRVSISPTFPSSLYSSPARSRASDSPAELAHLESSRSIQTAQTSNVSSLSSMTTLKEGLAQAVQDLALSSEAQIGRPQKPSSFDFEVV